MEKAKISLILAFEITGRNVGCFSLRPVTAEMLHKENCCAAFACSSGLPLRITSRSHARRFAVFPRRRMRISPRDKCSAAWASQSQNMDTRVSLHSFISEGILYPNCLAPKTWPYNGSLLTQENCSCRLGKQQFMHPPEPSNLRFSLEPPSML